jgi:2-C-methyl-D-erythritol 4-phosphate cytidylyltransferase
MHYWLVMPAAGAGRRFGSAKQFAAISARTMLEVALQPFVDDAQCRGGSIVLAPDEGRRGCRRASSSSPGARNGRTRCSTA